MSFVSWLIDSQIEIANRTRIESHRTVLDVSQDTNHVVNDVVSIIINLLQSLLALLKQLTQGLLLAKVGALTSIISL